MNVELGVGAVARACESESVVPVTGEAPDTAVCRRAQGSTRDEHESGSWSPPSVLATFDHGPTKMSRDGCAEIG